MGALLRVMQGEKIPDGQAKGALAEAVNKLKSAGGRIERIKEMGEAAADAAIMTAEIQGTVFTAAFAEGYLGEEKMDVGPVDVRGAAGLVTSAYGFYNVMQGKGGEHALAIGNGLLATATARIGRNAGRALKEKGQANAPAANGPAQVGNAPANTPLALPNAAGDFGDLVRNIMLTPEAGASGAERGGRHKPSRFIEVEAR